MVHTHRGTLEILEKVKSTQHETVASQSIPLLRLLPSTLLRRRPSIHPHQEKKIAVRGHITPDNLHPAAPSHYLQCRRQCLLMITNTAHHRRTDMLHPTSTLRKVMDHRQELTLQTLTAEVHRRTCSFSRALQGSEPQLLADIAGDVR